MSRLKKIIILTGIIALASGFINTDFFSFSLNDLNNQSFSFSGFKQNKATVVIFLLSDCPASQSYTLTINNLSKKYEKDRIGFVGVFPGTYSNDSELQKFRNDYKVKISLLKDPQNSLVKFLHATIAPGCFVIDKEGNILYEGRIDNWMFAVGKKRAQITEHNLDDALNSVVTNTAIKIKKTNPVGCFLEYE